MMTITTHSHYTYIILLYILYIILLHIIHYIIHYYTLYFYTLYYYTLYIYIHISKLADCSRGQPEGSLFRSYYTTPFPGLLHLPLIHTFIMLSAK